MHPSIARLRKRQPECLAWSRAACSALPLTGLASTLLRWLIWVIDGQGTAGNVFETSKASNSFSFRADRAKHDAARYVLGRTSMAMEAGLFN